MATSINVTDRNTEELQEAMSCSVCLEAYEETLRTPLVLPCGHTFCRSCMKTSLKRCCPYCSRALNDQEQMCCGDTVHGKILCPTCRKEHNNVQVEALVVNFSFLNLLRFRNQFTCEKCETHGDDLRYWCTTCDLPLCSLCLYSGHPEGHTVKLAQTFVQEKKCEVMENINQCFKDIEGQKEELKGCFKSLDADMKKLFHRNACLHDKVAELTDLCGETKKASDIGSIKYVTKAVKTFKSNMKTALSGSDVSNKEKAKDLKVKDKLNKNRILPYEKTGKSSLTSKENKNQETTEVPHATIDYREGRLLLHSLAAPATPGLSFQVPSEVFLELSVGSKCLGRVFISLWSHMQRAQQMLALCMGTMGPSLLDAKASDTERSIINFKYVVHGDDEARSQALLTGLEWEWGGQYAKPETKGYVTGLDYGNDRMNSIGFGICTKSYGSANIKIQRTSQGVRRIPSVSGIMQAPFGKVVAGLEVVKAAMEHNPINEVTITSSGLVLPGLSLTKSSTEDK